ncbi:MAG: BACON domain-containing carbohydrate-binding protein [Desulfosalsimonadaceae bacterium]
MIEWTYHKTPDNLHPNGMEQQMVWLMNRARANPTNEGDWLATSTDPRVADGRDYFNVDTTVLQNEFASYSAKPPAAFDIRLYNAAKAHSEDLIARDAQDHTGQFDRIDAAGFSYISARGNVFSYADDGLNAHAAFNIDWGEGTLDGMQPGRGHRQAIMSLDGNYTNVGIASVSDSNPSSDVGPEVVTGNFCYANLSEPNHYNRFIVGTVWEDLNDNGMYDPEEGKSGVTVMPDLGNYYAVTSASGGYAFPATVTGTYQLSFSGSSVSSWASSVSVNNISVLLDYLVGEGLSSLSVSPVSRNVAKESGITTFSVSNTGAGTMPWSAVVISGGSWLSITSGVSGSNNGTITCGFLQNTDTSSRTGTIRITATGATGSPADITVTQAGAPAVTLSGLSISGPVSINENSSAIYTATASWSDGSTSTVTPSWSENSAYASISASGMLIAVDIAGNQSVTITASYASGGITRTATKSVTIVNQNDIILQEGFEGEFFTTDYGDIPVGWNAYGSKNIQFSRITNAFEGAYALRAQGTFDPDDWTVLQKEFTVPPGTRFEASLKIRVDANTPIYAGAEMGICFREVTEENAATCKNYVWYSDSASYESKSAQFTSATGNFYLIIKLGAADGGGIASFDIDALTITVITNTADAIGLFDPAAGTFYLRNELSPGNADTSFRFGAKNAGWQPLAGDWDGDGQCSIGLFDPLTNTFFLKDFLTRSNADYTFRFGPRNAGWQPITGDWNGDGQCGFGLFDPLTNTFFLKNAFSNGNADYTFRFGPKNAGWQPITGDWDGDGQCSIGLFDPGTGTFFLKNAFSNGNADYTFRFGPQNAGWQPIAGNWDGDGTDGVGLYNPATSSFYLKNGFSVGNADIEFGFGPDGMGWIPLAGSWLPFE